jgi:hypothetical protein
MASLLGIFAEDREPKKKADTTSTTKIELLLASLAREPKQLKVLLALRIQKT